MAGVRAAEESEREKQQPYEALKQQRAERKNGFDKTPEGKKAKTARENALRKAKAQQLVRVMLAEMIGKNSPR
jgi:hypothetical protein